MKNSILFTILLMVIITMSTGCQLVGDIFKAGFWSAFIVIGFVLVLVIYIITRLGMRRE
jgi:hypothetical protein